MYGMTQVGRFLLRTPLVTAVITAVVVFGGGIYVFASGNGSGSTTGEIFLEPADQLGADPFLNQLRTPVPTIVLARQLLPDERKNGTASLSGGTVGLYGGTLNNSLCDRDQLAEFLTTNPGHARAWASVHDITIEQIPAFIANLTPVQLRLDTRVTNHGYLNGDATPLQSVLQAGTAVLVDRSGVPRARCACGNPLLAPQVAANMDFVGTPWGGFDAKSLLRVTPHDGDLMKIVLHDAATGTLFERAVGTDGDKDNAHLQVKAKPTTSASTTPRPFSPGSTNSTNTPTSAMLPTTASVKDPTTTRAQASAVPTTVRKTTTTQAPNTTSNPASTAALVTTTAARPTTTTARPTTTTTTTTTTEPTRVTGPTIVTGPTRTTEPTPPADPPPPVETVPRQGDPIQLEGTPRRAIADPVPVAELT